LSSSDQAWQETKGNPALLDIPRPADVMLWATAATTHAVSWFHLDDHGMSTFVHMETGSKYWVVARPKRDRVERAYKNFGAACSFESWVPAGSGSEFWDHEGVVLTAGDKL
jgi:hypothetical protein